MKSFFKNHWLVILVFLVVTSCIVFACINFIQNQMRLDNNRASMIYFCENEGLMSSDKNIVDNCEQVIARKDIQVDFYTMLTDVLLYRLSFLNGVAFLIVVIPTIFELNKKFKNKRKILFAFFKQAYKYVWLLPTFALILIGICACSYTMDPTYALTFSTSMWQSDIVFYLALFILGYLLNMLFYSFIFVNISLVVLKKGYHWILTVLLAYVLYIFIELFFEVVLVFICNQLFNSSFGVLFNIMNLFTFSDVFGIGILLAFSFVIFLLSFMSVYIVYSKKNCS